MKLFRRLFSKSDQEAANAETAQSNPDVRSSNPSQATQTGSEEVETELVEIPTTDPIRAAFLERLYAAAYPCSCGEKWEILSTSSAFPRAWMSCRCPKCGKLKEFAWVFYESGEQTFEGYLKRLGLNP